MAHRPIGFWGEGLLGMGRTLRRPVFSEEDHVRGGEGQGLLEGANPALGSVQHPMLVFADSTCH